MSVLFVRVMTSMPLVASNGNAISLLLLGVKVGVKVSVGLGLR
jgi:hypothetical protein